MKSCLLVLALMSAYCLAAPQIGGMVGGTQNQNPENGLNDAKLSHFQYLFKNDNAYNCQYYVYKMLDYSTQVVAGTKAHVGYLIKSPYDRDPRCSKELYCKGEIWHKPGVNTMNGSASDITVSCQPLARGR